MLARPLPLAIPLAVFFGLSGFDATIGNVVDQFYDDNLTPGKVIPSEPTSVSRSPRSTNLRFKESGRID